MPSRFRGLLLLGVAVVVISLLWFAFGNRRPAEMSGASAPKSTPPPSLFSPRLVPTVTPVAIAEAVATPTPRRTPRSEVGELQLSLRDYRAAFGSNPVGNNAEVTRALLGENPRKAAFVEGTDVMLNEQGEMLDRWGRPYFFHAITGTFMEVRSAGPDGVLFTADDIVGE
jgi:hypothetical protein